MRLLRRISGVGVIGAAALTGSVLGEGVAVEGGRYQLILDRNAFGLKDPPPVTVAPPPAPSNSPPVEVNLKLSGVSKSPVGKFAYFVVPPRPGKNTNDLYWKIEEGSVHDEIQVVSIDYEEGAVTVINAGQRSVLNLEEHSPTSVGPAVAPGAPAVVPGAPRVPGARPGVPVPARGATAPTSTVRPTLPARGGASQPMMPGAGSVGGGVSAVGVPGQASLVVNPGSGAVSFTRTVPARPLRTVPAENDAVDPAMQWLLLKAQEERARQEGVPMPPTPPMPGLQP